MKSKFKIEWNMGMYFTFLVMAELILVTVVSWIIAEVLKITDLPVIVWLVVSSLIIGCAINNFLSKRFLNPILKLGKAMRQVAEGDFSVRLEVKKEAKEIKDIYYNFNRMAKELGATEILQTDFVSNVSHEFKTPISAIEGYATLLQGEGQTVSEEQETYIEKILFNTRRLSHLVGNILLLSKIDNQAIQSRRTKYRLDEQIRQSIVMLEPEWSKKEIEFDAEMEDISYTGNESLLHHVWDNLISNAVKFSPAGGMIHIRMNRKEGRILFVIRDQGPGISEEAQKHIFDKFYQGDSSHREEGNGLGLALVKKILELCRGKIRVENVAGGGCEFAVILEE